MKIKIITIIALLLATTVQAAELPLKTLDYRMVKNKEHNYKEADYVDAYCNGQIEYVLNDKTRIDCLTDDFAIEFDWAKKWAESIGQSLYYARMTGKKPAVAIIMKSKRDMKYIKRIIKADKGIKIFKIKAYND